MKKLLPILLLALTGCTSSAQDYHDKIVQNAQAEDTAFYAADKEVAKICADNKMPGVLPRSQYVKYNQCATDVYERHVLPVAAYPDLFMRFRAQTLEYAQQYQDGKISFAQTQSRGKMAWLDYLDAKDQKANNTLQYLEAQDAMERANIARAFQNTPSTTYTNCSSYGGSTRCTTR